MGYTTEFYGKIKIDPPLDAEEIAYLTKFNETRRMYRKKGPYFVDGTGDFGQGHDDDIVNYNQPDPSQPSLWCGWTPTEDGTAIEWDGGEKFYEAAEWMAYILFHFVNENPNAKILEPVTFGFLRGHTANGVIEANGEEPGDLWQIVVKNGMVTTKQGKVYYE